jgi:hypothetical protein
VTEDPAEDILRGLSTLATRYLHDMACHHDDDEVERLTDRFGDVVCDGQLIDVLTALTLVVGKIIHCAPNDLEATACFDAFIAALRFSVMVRE